MFQELVVPALLINAVPKATVDVLDVLAITVAVKDAPANNNNKNIC